MNHEYNQKTTQKFHKKISKTLIMNTESWNYSWSSSFTNYSSLYYKCDNNITEKATK